MGHGGKQNCPGRKTRSDDPAVKRRAAAVAISGCVSSTQYRFRCRTLRHRRILSRHDGALAAGHAYAGPALRSAAARRAGISRGQSSARRGLLFIKWLGAAWCITGLFGGAGFSTVAPASRQIRCTPALPCPRALQRVNARAGWHELAYPSAAGEASAFRQIGLMGGSMRSKSPCFTLLVVDDRQFYNAFADFPAHPHQCLLLTRGRR